MDWKVFYLRIDEERRVIGNLITRKGGITGEKLRKLHGLSTSSFLTSSLSKRKEHSFFPFLGKSHFQNRFFGPVFVLEVSVEGICSVLLLFILVLTRQRSFRFYFLNISQGNKSIQSNLRNRSPLNSQKN